MNHDMLWLFLVFETSSVILDQVSNEHVNPAIHIYLAFIWCITGDGTTKHIDELVGWQEAATFLTHGYIWSQYYSPDNFFGDGEMP